MSQLMTLRLYFTQADKAPKTRRLNFFRPSLAGHILKQAAQAGIEQVILHRVESGYLKGHRRVAHHHVEAINPHMPHCIEMIDLEGKLRDFVRLHAEHLAKVRAVFLPCEIHHDPLAL
jgi:PII-like signaling protein